MAEQISEYDELKAIEYIKGKLSQEKQNAYSDDDILLIIDAMFDFYDENDDFFNDEQLEVDELIKYVKKAVKKDADNVVSLDDIETIIKAELEYEDSLEI